MKKYVCIATAASVLEDLTNLSTVIPPQKCSGIRRLWNLLMLKSSYKRPFRCIIRKRKSLGISYIYDTIVANKVSGKMRIWISLPGHFSG